MEIIVKVWNLYLSSKKYLYFLWLQFHNITNILFYSLDKCSDGKESACSVEDLGLIPGSGRSLEKGMASHSSIPAWEIPCTKSLVGNNPWGYDESDTTEWLTLSLFKKNLYLWLQFCNITNTLFIHLTSFSKIMKSSKSSWNFRKHTISYRDTTFPQYGS